jgi:hypothetical protein
MRLGIYTSRIDSKNIKVYSDMATDVTIGISIATCRIERVACSTLQVAIEIGCVKFLTLQPLCQLASLILCGNGQLFEVTKGCNKFLSDFFTFHSKIVWGSLGLMSIFL